ncbi:hypothetical protein BDR05DRAFT_1001573 [Suillus weaverae]|nr:hypothetical protein BDR05DRAFT_1001573 [Suillus weaverae]
MSQGDMISSSPAAHVPEEETMQPIDNTIGTPAADPQYIPTILPLHLEEDPYDYGWDDPTSIEPPAVELAAEDVAHNCKLDGGVDAQQEDDPNDGIDQPTVAPAGIEEDPYDCRWDDPSSIKPPTVESTMDDILHDRKSDGSMDAQQEDDPYDCGWQDGIEEPTVSPEGKEEDAYDCGWDDPTSVEPPTVESVKEDGLHDCKSDGGADAQQDEDPYDCGWQDGTDEPTVPPTGNEEDIYDCGWDDGTDVGQGIVAVPLDVTTEDTDNCRWDAMDTDIPDSTLRDDLRSDGDSHMTSITFSGMKKEPDDDIIVSRNLGTVDLTSASASPPTSRGGRPYAFGTTIDLTSSPACNAYIQQIVMPNVAPMNEQTLAAIFAANQSLFGTYAEASNWVTELGEDVVAIYHLLDSHRRIMDPLDAMLYNLHGLEDE